MVAGEFEGVRWKVVWNYEDEPNTLCVLHLLKGGALEVWTSLTVKHPSDPPNREVARRVSLERLLRGGDLEPEPSFGFSNPREFRREVWRKYWGRKG